MEFSDLAGNTINPHLDAHLGIFFFSLLFSSLIFTTGELLRVGVLCNNAQYPSIYFVLFIIVVFLLLIASTTHMVLLASLLKELC